MNNHFPLRTVAAIASIFAFRMLGLFMILPVFSLYAHNLSGHTPTLIGVALGIYGLSQALLQIPFGMLSDRFGRRPLILIGLIIFALGSVVAATSHHIVGVIIGRALQGAGAIGSTLIALIADVTSEQQRTKAMALLGMTIGISFSLSMLLGPLLNSVIGVTGIFWLTAALAVIGMVMTHAVLPSSMPTASREITTPTLFRSVLTNRELLRLDLGIFIQHAILTATFVVVPILLAHRLNVAAAMQWRIYFPVLLLSFLSMVPLIVIAEKRGRMKLVFVSAIMLLVLSQIGLLLLHTRVWEVVVMLYVYFTGFNLLEAMLPSLISKIAPSSSKGTAMGIYSCSQFLGIFCGGSVGGWLYGWAQIDGVFSAAAALSLAWLFIAVSMKQPQQSSLHQPQVGALNEVQAKPIRDSQPHKPIV